MHIPPRLQKTKLPSWRAWGRGTVAALVAPAVVAISAVVPAPRAAVAQTASAIIRCTQDQPPDETETVTHAGNQRAVSFPSWTNPPNVIFSGDVVRVRVTGSVRIDHWHNYYGPGGATGDTKPTEAWWKSWQGVAWPFPALNAFASVARWNNNPSGWVGDPVRSVDLSWCVHAPTIPVRLVYDINDPGISDNGGQWTITTDVYRANGKTCPSGQYYAGLYGCIPRPW